jgi:hypothetical protein
MLWVQQQLPKRRQFAAGVTTDPKHPKYDLHSLRHAAASLFETQQQQAKRSIEATLSRPADISVTLLARHLPALVEKAQPFIRRDYGTVGLSPEFDGEIRYFIEQVILADLDYLRAVRAAMAIDPTARERLLGPAPSQIVQIIRSTISAAIADPAEASQADAIAKEVISRG